MHQGCRCWASDNKWWNVWYNMIMLVIQLSLGECSRCMALFLCTNDKAQTADSTWVRVYVCWIHMHTAVMRKTWHLNHTRSKKNLYRYKHQSTCHEIQESWCVKWLAQVVILCITELTVTVMYTFKIKWWGFGNKCHVCS